MTATNIIVKNGKARPKNKNGILPKLGYGEVSLVHDLKGQEINFAQAYHNIKSKIWHK